MNVLTKIRKLNISASVLFFTVVYLVLVIKVSTAELIYDNWLFGAYSIAVSFYILSRFAISHFHVHHPEKFDPSYEPTISFGIPCKNEEENIYETIMRIATVDYPQSKFDIIVINDGSTDNTLAEMHRAQRDAEGKAVVRVIDWKKNRGKRDGMAECIKQSTNDVVVFIDSDSFIEPSTPKELVKFFKNSRVAAVAGHAYVANADKNIVTKMQSVRYFVAFKAYKGSESVFESVTCCSGCCSAYRRDLLASLVDRWKSQKFLGTLCTYGDDRSLTNYILKAGYKAVYAEKAVSYTFVPDTFPKFMKQQLRWKKSWVRESLLAATFMWKKNPIMSLSFYLGIILPLLAPLVVFRALIWYPWVTGNFPWFYIFGLLLMSTVYGLYYNIHMNDRKWVYGSIFAVFYTLILIWQLPYAILTLRDTRWGTR